METCILNGQKLYFHIAKHSLNTLKHFDI